MGDTTSTRSNYRSSMLLGRYCLLDELEGFTERRVLLGAHRISQRMGHFNPVPAALPFGDKGQRYRIPDREQS